MTFYYIGRFDDTNNAPEIQAVEYKIGKLLKYHPEDSRRMLKVGKGNELVSIKTTEIKFKNYFMNNAKHTQGTWQLSKSGEVVYAGVLSVATTHGHHNSIANAKLIAAAPDLLEALQAMDELDKLPHLSDKWWKQAEKADKLRHAAIKKATE